MPAKHALLRLSLLAGLALPVAALATDPLNMPPPANDPIGDTRPQPTGSAAQSAAAAQAAVATSNSIAATARDEIAESRREAARNLDAGVRGEAPPAQTTGPSPSRAAVQRAAEDSAVFEGMDAEERAAAQRAIARMPIFEGGEAGSRNEAQRAIDGMPVFGDDCEDPDFSDQKGRVRAGLEQGQQYGLQSEASLRSAAQTTGLQAYADLADKLQKQRLAYSNVDERVDGVGGTNGCPETKPKPKPPKTPSPKGPKGPKPPPARRPKAPGGGSASQPAEQQTPVPPGEVGSEFPKLVAQAWEVEDRLYEARTRYREVEQRQRDAAARGEEPPVRTVGEEQLRRDIAYMEGQLRDLRQQIQIETEARRTSGTPSQGDIRDRMQPGLTSDVRPSLPQHQANDTRTTEQLQRDLHDARADAQRRRKEAKALYDEVVRREQDARARGEDAPPRSAADERARREVEYQEARIIDADRQLNALATDTTSPRALQDRETAVQRRLDEAVRLRENLARQREAAVARGENPPVTARDRDLAREVEAMREELKDLDEQLSETNPGRPRPITDPKTGATARTPPPKPQF